MADGVWPKPLKERRLRVVVRPIKMDVCVPKSTRDESL